MAGNSTTYTLQPGTFYGVSAHDHANQRGPYYQSQYTSYSMTGYAMPSGLGLHPSFSSSIHTPLHAPFNRGYPQDQFLHFQKYSQSARPDLAQHAAFSPFPAAPQSQNANINPPVITKRGRGRPLGSKNKDKDTMKPPPKLRGRPRGSMDIKPRSGYNFKDPKKEAVRRSRKHAAPQQEVTPPTSFDDAASSPRQDSSPPTSLDNTASSSRQDPSSPTSFDDTASSAQYSSPLTSLDNTASWSRQDPSSPTSHDDTATWSRQDPSSPTSLEDTASSTRRDSSPPTSLDNTASSPYADDLDLALDQTAGSTAQAPTAIDDAVTFSGIDLGSTAEASAQHGFNTDGFIIPDTFNDADTQWQPITPDHSYTVAPTQETEFADLDDFDMSAYKWIDGMDVSVSFL